MELENDDDGWRNEMGKFIRSVENLTETALKRIKRDRIQKNLPFDEGFQNYFLQRTTARIAHAYNDFLLDENCEGGQSHSNQDVNQRSANENSNIFEMPVVLEQSNNQNPNAVFVQNDNEMLEQIVISTPSNPLTIPQNLEQESHAQSVRANVPVAIMERLIESEPNSGNENRNTVRGRSAMESASTSVGSREFDDSFGRMVVSNMLQPETIDLTTDEGEASGVTGGKQSGDTVLNVQLQGRCPTEANKDDAYVENRMIISKSQIELSPAQQRMGGDVHVIVPLSPNTNHAIIADGNDDLELAFEGAIATAPKVNDNQRIGPIALPEVKTEFNLNEAASDKARARNNEEGSQRLDVTSSLNLQYPESIDLISDGEAAKNSSNVVQPTIQRRKIGDDGATTSESLKKMSKLANKRTVDTKKRHKCDFCEYSTLNKSHLNYHIRTHTNERPHRCEVCDKRFTQQQNLTHHMKTHRDMFAFQCPNCRQGFSTEKEWKSHESRCKAKGYECHLCKKVFIDKKHLVGHMQKHTGEKLRCMKCRKQFSSNDCLVRHMKSHGNLFRFQCSKCRLGLSKKKQWKLHESRCKSKRFECFLCGKKFHQQKCNLSRHIRHKHTGEKPFGCSECPLRFCEKSNLTRHTNSHH